MICGIPIKSWRRYISRRKISKLLLNEDEMIKQLEIYREFNIERYHPDYLVIPFQYYNLPPKVRDIWALGFPEISDPKFIIWKDKWSNMAKFLYPLLNRL